MRTHVWTAAAVLLLAACSGPAPPPGEIELPAARAAIPKLPPGGIGGVVRYEDGQPAHGVPVEVSDPGPGLVEALVGAMTAVASLGLFCLPDDGVLCGVPPSEGGVTRHDGRFAVTAGSVRPGTGNRVSAALPPADGAVAGPRASYAVDLASHAGALPELRFWQPPVTFAASPVDASVTWTPPSPAAFGAVRGYTVRLLFGDDPVPDELFSQRTTAQALALDPRVLEDAAWQVVVEAEVDGPGAPAYDYRLASPTVRAQGAGAVPVSRNAPCSYVDLDATPRMQSPCRLTNGALGDGFFPERAVDCDLDPQPACDDPRLGEAIINLGEDRDVSFAVIRSRFPYRYSVDGSLDGQLWFPLAASPEETRLALLPLPHTSVRSIRIRAPRVELNNLSEVSIW